MSRFRLKHVSLYMLGLIFVSKTSGLNFFSKEMVLGSIHSHKEEKEKNYGVGDR